MQQNLKRFDLSLLKQEIASLMLCCLLIAFQIYSVSHAHDFELESEFNCGLCHKTNSDDEYTLSSVRFFKKIIPLQKKPVVADSHLAHSSIEVKSRAPPNK